MKAKKVLSLLLVGAMAMSILAGCGQEKDTKKESEAQKSSEVSKEEKNEVESETKEETGVTPKTYRKTLLGEEETQFYES